MSNEHAICPDCGSEGPRVSRRDFLATGAAAVAATSLAPGVLHAGPTARYSGEPESLVKVLYNSLSEQQRGDLCFDWDYQDPQRGLLRTRVANNWNITNKIINSSYYNDEQRDIIRAIFEGLVQPDWHARLYKQLDDDAGGFGEDQSLAIFGKPGDGKFEFVMTGRHMTIRCDGNSADHVAFGGPIFYGHAASDFNEPADHPGNVFWHQALEANKVFDMLDGKQRKVALVPRAPREQEVGFRGPGGDFPGLPIGEMTADQKEQMQKVLQVLIEPYRQSDRDEVVACLKAQGGLDACSLAFYAAPDIGNDGVWDCWRLEGPSFVWYYRGAPHVHVWVNVANNPGVKLNA